MTSFQRNDGTTVTTDIPEIVARLREHPDHTEVAAADNAHREAQHAALHALNVWFDARGYERRNAELTLRERVKALRRAASSASAR